MKTADSIVRLMRTWKTESREMRIVVGLDGYSGMGKTTIAREIAQRCPDISVISMDDIVCTANTKDFLNSQLDRNDGQLKLMWKPEDGIKKLRTTVSKWRKKPGKGILLVEGIFLFHPDLLNDLWDKRIYLDGNMKQADSRRVAREKKRWGKQYFPETHPDSFACLFKIAHRRYRILYRPRRIADVVIRAF
jgi:uridine kinase